MKRKLHLSGLTWILLVLGFSTTIRAQTLSGRVYEGEYLSEPPTAKGLTGVTVTLYGSNNSGQRGTYITSTTTGSDGWYGLEAEQGYEFYTIVCGGKSGYSFQGSSSVSGSASGEEIQYSLPLAGKTLTGNKFWYTSNTPPPTNNPPVAKDDSATTPQDTAVDIDVLYNDNDPDGDPLHINSATDPPHGTTVNHGSNITYTPDSGFTGTDTFDYIAGDGKGGTDTATVTVTVDEGGEPPTGTGILDGYKRDADTGAGLENWRIFIDLNGNGTWDPREPSAITNTDGYYQITDVEPGTYRVCEQMQDGWEGDQPCVEGVTIVEGTMTTQDFYNRRTEGPAGEYIINGVKYNDLNDNGIKDPNEPGLGGWRITLEDGDHNLLATATTDYNGQYTLTITEPGTYIVDEVQQPGWRQTDPVGADGEPSAQYFLFSELPEPYAVMDYIDFGNHREETPEGQDYTSDVCFNVEITTPTGTVEKLTLTGPMTQRVDVGPNGEASDMGGNGREEVITELVSLNLFGIDPIVGQVRMSLNANMASFGQIEERANNTPGVLDIPPFTATGDADSFIDVFFQLEVGGTVFLTNQPIRLTAIITHLPPVDDYSDISQTKVELLDQNGQPTGYQLSSITSCQEAPLEGAGTILGVKFNDLNGNGQRDIGEPGLPGWQIMLEDIEDPGRKVLATTTTDSNGLYTFTGLEVGWYLIEEEQKPGWKQTYPGLGQGAPCAWAVLPLQLMPDFDYYDFNFGNHWTGTEPPEGAGSIRGVKFNDLNENGRKDADEPGLSGWKITLMDNDGFVLATTTTNRNGEYQFDNLEPGTYGVSEEDKQDWFQTFPAEKHYSGVRLSQGEVLMDMDFGNHWTGTEPPGGDGGGSVVVIKEATPADDTPFLFCANFRPGGFFDTLCAYLTDPSNNTWTINNPNRLQKVGETVPAGWILTDITITGDTDNGSLVHVFNHFVDVDYDEGENIVITFKNKKTGEGQYDFGDAPDPTYPTLLVNNGARHRIDPTMYLGSSIDPEMDGQPTSTADGDNTGGANDEDGVTMPSIITAGQSIPINVVASSAGTLNAWIDFNINGDWADPGEHFIAAQPVVPGTNTFTLIVPASVQPGQSFARFRFSSERDIGFDGEAPDGEVEDYAVAIQEPGRGSLTIIKDATPKDDTPFWISVVYGSMGGAGPYRDPSSNRSTLTNGPSGTYYIGEAVTSGWILKDIVVTGDTDNGTTVDLNQGFVNVDLDDGEAITVVFKNEKTGNVEWDFGDAPDSYKTYHASGGPYHDVGQVMFGSSVDAETDGQPGPLADTDSDDGISFPLGLEVNKFAIVLLNVNAPSGVLTGIEGWIDYDQSQTFETDELFVTTYHIGVGVPVFQAEIIQVPGDAVPGWTYARFRIHNKDFSAGGLSPTGYGSEGEVEDYRVEIKAEGTPAPPGAIIGGIKFNDLNDNEVWDTNEPALPGWTIWLDANQNGIEDAGDQYTKTDTSGYFQFVGLAAGQYLVGEVQQTDWTQTAPVGGTITVTVGPNAPSLGILFGNRQSGGPTYDGRICGSKWNDLNGDSIPDANEPFLAGWNIYLDINHNGRWDIGEPSQTTDATGFFEFTGLAVGSYTVAEEMKSGWKQTWPGGTETHIISVQSTQVQPECVMFGNQQIGTGLSLDWGDAPDPNYPTLRAGNGAYHVIVPGIFLGGGVDPDADGQPAPDARGDDSDGSDDEDGVFFISPLMPGQQAEVEVIASSAGYLDASIDFDADGSWSQASDQIFTSEPILAGSNILYFQVPSSIAIDIDTYARFRFSSAGGLAPDGPAQDGEVEDYHILLGENGPGVPGEEEMPHVKWSQPPIEIDPNINVPPVFCGWNEPARSTEQSGQIRQWRMDADDFRCLGPIPVTRIRWWGGYKAWASPGPPELQPTTWHIGFWANQINGIDQNELFPERMVWSLEIPAERVHFEPVGLNEFPEKQPEICFVYEVELEPEEWFHQTEFESNDDVFWISITAIYPADAEPVNQWGWATRPHIWGSGAVMPAIMGDWPTYDERLFSGRIYPIENSLLCGRNQAYDLCFELLTEQSWVSWDQPFTDVREWQDYSDDKSMALESEEGGLLISREVVDDWPCELLDPVTAIVWNGSYIGYGYEACKCEEVPEPRRPDYFLLSIRDNTPGSDTEHDNHPGEKIWEFRAENYDEVLVGYDRNPDGESNEPVFRYSVRLPEEAWFRQDTPENIYWFSVVAVFRESSGEIPYDWGWTHRSHTFGSPALSIDSGTEATSQWQTLLDSTGRSVDMSFTLSTTPEQRSPTGQVYYSKSTDNGAMFEPGAIINNTSAEPAPRINPAIAVDDQGIIHVVWEDYGTDPALANIMYAKSMNDGMSFDESVMVDDAITVSTHQAKPQIAVDIDGVIHVAWEDYRRDSRLGDIYYAKSTDGGMTFGDDVCVDDLITITSRQINPVIAVDSRRIIHVAWEDYRDNAEFGNIYYAKSTDGGQTFGTDIRIDDIFTDTTHQCNPAIATDPLGTVFIVWEDYRNAPHLGDIYCARSTDGGETFQENLIVDDLITITHRQIRPAVAVDNQGIVYVVWEDYRDNTELGNIYCARSMDHGQTFEDDVMVDAIYTHTTHQANPAIATAGQGLVHIVWEDYRDNPEHANIYHSMSLDEGKTFGEDLVVNERGPMTSSRHNPAIAVDKFGVVHLVWQE